MELPKNYDFREVESKWKGYWAKSKTYKFDEKSKNQPFIIDTPPPTVSGAAHLGHMFSYSQQDFIARYKRMQGFNVFYPFGTDDNGLPTERLVEKLKNVKGTRMPRHEFIALCYKTITELKEEFLKPWKDIGMSADFPGYSTINQNCISMAQRSFIDLYKKGHVYQQQSPTMWCTSCQTAIAQAELEDVEFDSHFNDIAFKVGEEDLIIATTRPELLAACSAIMINPKDKRAKKLKGKFAKVPIFNQEVPIILDEQVDMEKGTGIVMCCTFGDKTDIEWWHKHKLQNRVILNKDGTLNELAGKYAGIKIKDARKQIIEDLEKNNLLLDKKPMKHHVNVHERCGTEVEFLETKQWFIRILDKKEKFIEAGEKIKWHPEYMKARYIHWVENLQWDWCISRQRFFGVPFPVWYDSRTSEIVLADEKQLPVDPLKDKPKSYKGNAKDLIPEYDVMDTWATSSLTPQILTSWDEARIPLDLRPQAHDIIRTWLFYTIVKSMLHHNKIPWKNIMISGYVLDPKGKKMSKSKGNIIEPKAVLDKFGADALRFWAAGSKLGEDLAFQEKEMITAGKTATKLWNASKFVFMHLEDFKLNDKIELEAADKWILNKLNGVIKSSTESLDNYEYVRTKLDVENFFWNQFCDYYLEICKDRLYNPEKRGEKARLSAQFTLYHCLNSILKLFAPIMPFVTEELYSYYFMKKEKTESIHLAGWPGQVENLGEADKAGDVMIDIIAAARKYKAEKKVSMKEPVNIKIKKELEAGLMPFIDDLKAVTSAEKIEFVEQEEKCRIE